MSLAIAIDNLSYSYPDGTRALDGISLQVQAGERVALLGANGAGKSTLLLHLNGILAPRGEVSICGIPVVRARLKEVRQKVGLVFQNPDDQLFCPTIFEDVAFGPRNLKLPEDEVRARVSRALEAVGLAGFEQRSVFHLSLGQKKRAAIATVLALDAAILALDEPTSGLDPRGRRQVIELLGALGRTQLLITHDLELSRKLCTRVLVLSEGRLVADGPPERVLDQAALLEEHGLV